MKKNTSTLLPSPKQLLKHVPLLLSPKRLTQRVKVALSPKRTETQRKKKKKSRNKSSTSENTKDDANNDIPAPPTDVKHESTAPAIETNKSGRRCSFNSPTGKLSKEDSLLDFHKKLSRISADGAIVKERSSKVMSRFDDISNRTEDILRRAKLASSKFTDLIETGEALQRGTANQRWTMLREAMKEHRLVRPSGTVLSSTRRHSAIMIKKAKSRERCMSNGGGANHPNQEKTSDSDERASPFVVASNPAVVEATP